MGIQYDLMVKRDKMNEKIKKILGLLPSLGKLLKNQ
jgi:hypothetical protein